MLSQLFYLSFFISFLTFCALFCQRWAHAFFRITVQKGPLHFVLYHYFGNFALSLILPAALSPPFYSFYLTLLPIAVKPSVEEFFLPLTPQPKLNLTSEFSNVGYFSVMLFAFPLFCNSLYYCAIVLPCWLLPNTDKCMKTEKQECAKKVRVPFIYFFPEPAYFCWEEFIIQKDPDQEDLREPC